MKKKVAGKRSSSTAARKRPTSRSSAGHAQKKKRSKEQVAKRSSAKRAAPSSRTGKNGGAKKLPHGHGTSHTLNGVSVVTPDGRAPSKKGAQGFVEGSRIKVLKFIHRLRSGGIGDIAELTASIRHIGIIEPIVVRPAGDGENFELIAGERRLAAAKAVGGRVWHDVPIIIRSDLQGDDDRAVVVAIAENSPDGRTNLNLVDIGRQASALSKKGWIAERMAKEMGLHVKTVRRAMAITEVPETIQERVRRSEISARAALELGILPRELQEKMIDEVGPHTTEREIRRMRKAMEREQEAEKASRGRSLDKVRKKSGELSTALKIASWQKARAKTLQIGHLCHALVATDSADLGTTQWHEMRGAIAYSLWDRGDINSPMIPSIHEEEMVDPATDKKVNALFDAIVRNEAARHEKRTDESDS